MERKSFDLPNMHQDLVDAKVVRHDQKLGKRVRLVLRMELNHPFRNSLLLVAEGYHLFVLHSDQYCRSFRLLVKRVESEKIF